MNYSQLSELSKTKGVLIKDLCLAVDMTRQGLQFSIDNQTIELRKLKLICEKLRISPAQFFEDGTFGLLQNTPKNQNKQIEMLEKEVQYLNKRLEDKEEIITLMKEKRSGYGIASEPKKY
ncbi:hypothetical protein TRIP_D300115 [uncultured Paludibacter sp.]|nr:hypothetical protein TRIP_D300115 [uncultured Paludibacter sp.]